MPHNCHDHRAWVGSRRLRLSQSRPLRFGWRLSTRMGSLHIPESYRRWEHVGTRIKPDGRSVLDGSQITTPEVMDTYVLPGAFDLFKKQGTWPDGTQIVKEISIIRDWGRTVIRILSSVLHHLDRASFRRVISEWA